MEKFSRRHYGGMLPLCYNGPIKPSILLLHITSVAPNSCRERKIKVATFHS